ncbi:MAG TPA: hypothetical protein ENN85_00730 [Methanoculleus sp.]|nr:hypothetical protein [Methanoculleus sp.]
MALHRALIDGGYEFLNAERGEELYDMLANRMGIRVAQKSQVIPNIELKFLKHDIDRCVLRDRLDVRIPEGQLYISPLEIQIAYKLFLGSEKDIEDALYLWEIFGDHLDLDRLRTWMNLFEVEGGDYGILV